MKSKVHLHTVLSDARSLEESEIRDLAEDWAKRTLDNLVAYAENNKGFAKKLCATVADQFGPDKELSGLLSKRLQAERSGKPPGRRRTWTFSRYLVLLIEYHALCASTDRQQVLEILAEKEGLHGDTRAKKIEDRITQARKLVKADDLPEALRPLISFNFGG